MTSQYTHQTTSIAKDKASISFWQEWYAKLERDLMDTMKNSVKVWGTAQSFNFLVLPAHTRVLFTNCVSVAWIAYLSVVGHRKHDDTSTDSIEDATEESTETQ